MKNGKYSNGKKSLNMKPLAVLLAMTLLVGCAIGGTIAWLTDNTGPVENTFTVGNIDIDLTETTGNTYKMVPGHTIQKDPYVTVQKGSEDCYVFIEVKKSEGFDKYMTYKIGDGWEKLDTVDNVYYRVVKYNAEIEQKFDVIKDHTIRVLDTVTKSDMAALKDKNPTLVVRAYAVQYWQDNDTSFEPMKAWELVAKS